MTLPALRSARSYLALFTALWLVWVFITAFVVQPFKIPSESMENTLMIKDRIVVNKLASIQRGDVVVFDDPGEWMPDDTSTGLKRGLTNIAEYTHLAAGGKHLVKRVVGVGGDRVSCAGTGAKLTVNGTAIDEPYVNPGAQPCDFPFHITVPKDHVWVMGDNRNHSSDSRYHDDGTGRTGSVPTSKITGEVDAVVWPFSRLSTTHLSAPSVFKDVKDHS